MTLGRRAVALALLGMVALSHAAPAPVDAAEEKTEWVTEDGVVPDDAPSVDMSAGGPAGNILIPSAADGGTAKFVHAMVASQVDMINEMVDKIHPGLHGPLMGLTTMMMAVQEQVPQILAGKPAAEPSQLVHEMFVRYANGTKTDADLSQISKGLDELFTHEYTADDAAKAIDLVNAKDLFGDAGPKPQLFPNTTIPFQPPPVKVWPNVNATRGLKPNEYDPTNITFKAGPKDNAIIGKYNDTLAGKAQWVAKQKVWDAAAKSTVDPIPAQIKATGAGSIFAKELSMARKVGAAYKIKDPKLVQPGDPFSTINADEAKIWKNLNNNTKALAAVGVAVGANINMTGLPTPKIKPFNLYKENQAELLELDKQKLNLTVTAFPENQGFDWLRLPVDKFTTVPIDDRVAPALSYLQFRDPVLGEVFNAKTVTSTPGSKTPARTIFDPSADTKLLYKSGPKFVDTKTLAMTNVKLADFSFQQFQYRPCIINEGYTGLGVSPEFIRVRPEAISVSVTGASADPQFLTVDPTLIKVQAVGVQDNPDFINVEPILVSVAPKANIAGKAVAKKWQISRPGAPSKDKLFKDQGGFKLRPAQDKAKTLAPYPKPHT